MTRKYIAAMVAAIAVLTPATADASTRGDVAYSANVARHKVVMRHGAHAAGRDIVKYGVRFVAADHSRQTRRAKVAELRTYRDQLNQLIRPIVTPRLHRMAVPPPQPPAGVATSATRASLPDCTWRPESGGDYGAVNPSSGAYGKYQIIPSTWAAHCSDLGRGPSGQETCAARVFQAQGAGAWVNC